MNDKNRCEHGVWIADHCYECPVPGTEEHLRVLALAAKAKPQCEGPCLNGSGTYYSSSPGWPGEYTTCYNCRGTGRSKQLEVLRDALGPGVVLAVLDRRDQAIEACAEIAINKGKSASRGYTNLAWEIAEECRALKTSSN